MDFWIINYKNQLLKIQVINIVYISLKYSIVRNFSLIYVTIPDSF